MTYKSDMDKYKESNLYAIRKYQSIDQNTIDILEDFIFWLEYGTESPEINKEHLFLLKSLINEYLGIDKDKIKFGELELLEKWNRSII